MTLFLLNSLGAKGSPCAVAMTGSRLPSEKHKLDVEVRFRVLRLLEQNPEMSQRDLAAAVGISTGSAHYVLKALVGKGFVKLGNFTASEDKRRYAYLLTAKGISARAAMTREFLARKKREYEALTSEIEILTRELEAADADAQS